MRALREAVSVLSGCSDHSVPARCRGDHHVADSQPQENNKFPNQIRLASANSHFHFHGNVLWSCQGQNLLYLTPIEFYHIPCPTPCNIRNPTTMRSAHGPPLLPCQLHSLWVLLPPFPPVGVTLLPSQTCELNIGKRASSAALAGSFHAVSIKSNAKCKLQRNTLVAKCQLVHLLSIKDSVLAACRGNKKALEAGCHCRPER
jgi:hypothetical protein